MVICDMGIVQSYLGNWGKRVNFGNGVAEILTKVWERKDKWCDGRREKIWILVILLLKFLLPNTLPSRWSARSTRWSARNGNQLWQPSCQNCKGVRREKIRHVATKLLKMGGKKKRELWQPSCQKLWKKFNSNLGNEVAENEGEKRRRFRLKLERKKNK